MRARFLGWPALPESMMSTRIEDPAVAVELLISESMIRDRLKAMGRQIEDDYRDKPLTIVAVLTGSLIALADLVRQIQIPLRIALVQASSYRGATTTATTATTSNANTTIVRCESRTRGGTTSVSSVCDMPIAQESRRS